MAGLNQVQLIGYLGRDPELRYTQSDIAVVSLSLATTHRFKRKGDDKVHEETEWHRVSVWGARAKACMTMLEKGSLVYVSGRLRTRVYEDKDGVKKWATEIVCHEWQGLSKLKPRDDRPDPGSDVPPKHDAFVPSSVDDDIPF